MVLVFIAHDSRKTNGEIRCLTEPGSRDGMVSTFLGAGAEIDPKEQAML